MDGDSWLLFILFFICVLCSGYFSSVESCFSTVDKMKIKTMADDGNKKAKNALYIINNFDSAITTILIGTNVLHTAAASIATVWLAKAFSESDPNFSLYCTLISTGFLFLFAEVIPKSFATDRCYTYSLFTAGSLIFFMKVFKPLSFFFTKVSSAFAKLFSKEEEPTITEDELYDIIDTAEEEGVVDEDQSDLIKSALDFSATTAEDVMTSIDKVVSIDIKANVNEIIETIKNTTHSRLPVYRNTPTNIVGTIQIRKFIKTYLNDEPINIRKLMTPSFYISKSDNIDDLLNAMTQHRAYLAVVKDEVSHEAIGIVTIEDFIEELVGEIWDEDDSVDDNFIELGGNKFLIKANMPIQYLVKKLELSPELYQDVPYGKKIISLFIEELGKDVDEDSRIEFKNLELVVETIENGKIEDVVVHISDEEVVDEESEEK